MLGISRAALDAVRQDGLEGLAERLEEDGNPEGVRGQVRTWSGTANRASVEALFSVLWQVRWPVTRLFPDSVARASVRSKARKSDQRFLNRAMLSRGVFLPCVTFNRRANRGTQTPARY